MKINKKSVLKTLETVIDPELNMSIVDLGLVYNVTVNSNNSVKIVMTLTTIGCPLFDVIENDIRTKLKNAGVSKVEIELTFDPPWSMEKMTERGKALLGI